MPVGVAAAARAIAAPRTATRRRASSSVSTPAIAAAASSPTECPAVTPTTLLRGDAEGVVGAEVEDGPQARQRRRDEQRLGDGGVPDGVGVRRGAVGDQVEAGRAGGPRDRLGDGRQLEPRGEHAGGLGALTGADDDEHATTLPGRRRPARLTACTNLLGRPCATPTSVSASTCTVSASTRRPASSRPSASAVCRTYDSRASSGSQPVTSATRRRR